MMRHAVWVIAVLFLLLPQTFLGQHGGRHATSGTNGGTTAQPEDSDSATFKRAVAEQATDEQIAQFHQMTETTEAARQQAQDLRSSKSNTGTSEDLVSKANSLQDAVDKALTDTRNFLRSFSDLQDASLKNLARKLTKAGAAVNKSGKAIAQEAEQTKLNSDRLIRTAESLEKALVELQSDQFNLCKEMGVPRP